MRKFGNVSNTNVEEFGPRVASNLEYEYLENGNIEKRL